MPSGRLVDTTVSLVIVIVRKNRLGEDINGCTALFYAISFQHVDVCRLLLDLKANPNHQDKRGRTWVNVTYRKARL